MERRVDVDGEVALDFPGDGNYNHRPPHSPTLGHTQWSQFSYENQTARPQVRLKLINSWLSVHLLFLINKKKIPDMFNLVSSFKRCAVLKL